MDTLKSVVQAPYIGQTVHPLTIYCPYIFTSEEGTTSIQMDKMLVHNVSEVHCQVYAYTH